LNYSPICDPRRSRSLYCGGETQQVFWYWARVSNPTSARITTERPHREEPSKLLLLAQATGFAPASRDSSRILSVERLV